MTIKRNTMAKKKFKLGLPVKLLGMILLLVFLGDSIPTSMKSFFYAISLTLKELLLLFLPFIIFSFLFSSLLSFKDGALKLVISLFTAVFASNFIATLFAYGASLACLSPEASQIAAEPTLVKTLLPLWDFSAPKFLSNQSALIGGAFLGVLFSYSKPPILIRWSQRLKSWSLGFLNIVFIPVVPVFVFGFLVKLDHEDLLLGAIKSYGPIVGLFVLMQVVYVIGLFVLASKGNMKRFWEIIKNIFPSALSGFSTMSSAATMPITLKAAEANTKDPILAEVLVPATLNIHLLGDCLGIPFLAMATLLAFGQALPDSSQYLTFALYFVLSRFAVVCVPGGCIFMILPLMEIYLGINGEMASLLAALCILLDPITTSVNVTGNGTFAIIFSQFYNKLFPKTHRLESSQLKD